MRKHVQHAVLLTSILVVTGEFLIPLVQSLAVWQQSLIYRILAFPIFIVVSVAIWGISDDGTNDK